MSGANSWLTRQRKSDLSDLAQRLGLKDYATQKKAELEQALDDFLSENSARYQSDSTLAPYYNSRARAIGSPVKKEAPELKVAKRRQTKAQEEVPADSEDEPTGMSTALARTPGRALSLASRIPLPASPADVAHAVDRSTLAVRERVTSIYHDSGIPEVTQITRESLSTVHAILFVISAFELFRLRPEVLADRYAFTIPAIPFLRTSDYPVHIPDMFLLLTSSFWSPVLLWAFSSTIVPAIFGYFFNLSAASHTGRGRKAHQLEYAVDPLVFSIAKAILTYAIYEQGVSFWGLVDQDSVARINSAIYGGWRGVIVGTFVTGLVSVYDAVLKK
ncbi:uncharacterized protein E0L32_008336 [Thyridium curvatum]|uniref:Rho termination factor N-terminal domain-containing protein n=1 Tax=Thyridium curvatum TaxID=1093900 RepID=A0A507ATH0_9PEZI|nr:uncharacterized protein E0L32_008336 [Thyridium curvatum]TPX10767.1 hypothetical protein E0L32_008336 [Thyridium curvatum]